MRGLPPDVDLSFLVGHQLSEVTVDQYRATLIFDDRVRITAHSACRIGGVEYRPGIPAGSQLVGLVGAWVRAARSVDGRHLSLDFDSGTNVVVLEDDEPFESYAIFHAGGCIAV